MQTKIKIKAIGTHIIAKKGNFGAEKTAGGIFVPKTLGKTSGIVPRWFEIVDIGSNNTSGLLPGQWVCVENGRWTEGFKIGDIEYWRLDPAGCMLVSDKKPDNFVNLAE